MEIIISPRAEEGTHTCSAKYFSLKTSDLNGD